MCLRYPLKFLRSIISNSEVAADPLKWVSIDEEAYREAVENDKALLPTAIMLNEMDDPAACERALRAAAYFGVPIIQVMRDQYEVHDYIQNDEDDIFEVPEDDYTFY